MPLLTFSIKAQSASQTKTIVKTRGFEAIVDEPEDLGGTNEGLNPVEYLLAAYAGCLNVLGHLVADEMDITLNGLDIEIEGGLDSGKFSGESDTERAGFQEIRVVIYPDCEAKEKDLNAWLAAIKERCPVGDNIADKTPIVTSIGERRKRMPA